MDEPDVTLTDYGLALECVILALLMLRLPAHRAGVRGHAILFFASLATASLFGGTVHGFMPDPASSLHRWVWALSLVAIGTASVAAWVIGGGLLLGPERAWPRIFAWLVFLAYTVRVASGETRFRFAILMYLSALSVLIAGLAREWIGARNRTAARAGVLGAAVTLASSMMQQAGLGLHSRYFDHNAVYHAMQAVALWLFFRCFHSLVVNDSHGSDRA